MKKTIKVMRWFLLNGFFCCMMWLGLYEANEWALNILKFWISVQWIFVLLTLVIIADDKLREKQRKKGPSVPLWIDQLLDIAIVMSFASCGWFWSAGAFLASIFVGAMIYGKKDEEEAEGSSG